MYRSHIPIFLRLLTATAALFCAAGQNYAQTVPMPPSCQPGQMRCITAADRVAAAVRAKAARTGKPLPPAPLPGGTPDYFGIYPNYANSPIIRKFVDSLPGVGCTNRNNLGQYIPLAVPVTNPNGTPKYPGSDYYEIGLKDYTERMNSDLPATGTMLRGYFQLNQTDACTGLPLGPHYLGPLILAKSGTPVRVKFTDMLGTGAAGNLFIPVDTTLMGAGTGPNGGTELYTQNRATLHLHGGNTPWISDGTPHQWITPAGDPAAYKKGVSQQNVPDMPDPGAGSATFFWSNQQSNRLMFYHDHVYGMTKLNVYAGEAAGYLLWDQHEEDLISGTNVTGINPGLKKVIPDLGGAYHYGIPLIIQDKTFVPDPATLAMQDPTWNWGGTGNLWFPHVYMTNQNPSDPAGVNAMGRWDYGAWFWPPVTNLVHGATISPAGVAIPGVPNVSLTPEAFMDTPVVNGTAYPYLNVDRRAYRFRILNAANDRTLNLQLYMADPTLAPTSPGYGKEVKMLPAVPPTTASTLPPCSATVTTNCNLPPCPANVTTYCWPASWPTDGRAGGVPDPTTVGPSIIQIGTEGGFLPAPVVLPTTPLGYDYNRRSITVLNVLNYTLLLGPAERADVIIDFSNVPAGSNVILYNDAAAPIPAFDPRLDYYTGDVDQSLLTGNGTGGAPTTQPGYGPNTRTIMQFRVSANTGPAADLAGLQALLPAAYRASQPAPVVPEVANGGATNNYARIQDSSMTFTPTGSTVPVTMPMQPKAIQELFELNYGRMNATLGVELPLTNFLTQTTIPYGYIDPPTEFVSDSQPQIWKITHNGVDTHFVHVHLFNWQVINRVGWDGQVKPPDANEVGWKETVRMNPLEDIIVAMRPVGPTLPFQVPNSVRPLDTTSALGTTGQFTGVDPNNNPVTVINAVTNFGWEYVWHCHILGHEENDFMRPIVFTPAADARAAMVTPAANSILTGASTAFTWNAGTGATQYSLWFGTTPGAYDIGRYYGTATSYTATGLPTTGAPLYVRLWSLVNNIWVYYDYAYTQASIVVGSATMTSPTAGSVLPNGSPSFLWTIGTGVTQYSLWLGTTPGAYDLGTYYGTGTTYTTTVPVQGATLYVRLWSLIANVWYSHDYTYTEANFQAAMLTPAPGTSLGGTSAAFTWSPGTGVTQYSVWLGSTAGAYDLGTYYGTGTTYTATVPANGGAILYVRLWSLIGNRWLYYDYTYTQATTVKAVMGTPVPGSVLTTMLPTFNWTAGTGVIQYSLWLGTTAGGYDLGRYYGTANSYTAAVPATGGTLYVRLWSLIGTTWQFADYTYTEASLQAVMVSPAQGSTIAGTSAAFAWSPGTGALQYSLWLGSAAGAYDLGTYYGTATTYTAALPAATGATLYVRLWTLLANTWQYADYTYVH